MKENNKMPRLWEHQEDILKYIDLRMLAGDKEIVVASSPSSGKTITAIQFIKNHPKAKFLILTHGTNVIKDLWVEEFNKYNVLYSTTPNQEKVTISLPQSSAFLIKNKVKVDFLIIDEAHEFRFAQKGNVEKIISAIKPKTILCLTGTPSKFIKRGFEPKIIPAIDLIDKKIISDVYFGIISSKVSIKESDFNNDDELKKKAIKRLMKSVKSDIDSYLDVAKHNGIEKAKTMIACMDIDQADKVYKYLVSMGYSAKLSTSDHDIESQSIDDFQKNRSITFLVVVRRGILGFSMKELTSVVDLTGSRNIDRIYQLYARVMRKQDRIPKKYFFKFASKEMKKHMCFYMNAALSLMFFETISVYDGTNLEKLKLPTKPGSGGGGGSSEGGRGIYTPSSDFDPKAMIPVGEFLKDVHKQIAEGTGHYKFVEMGDINREEFGKKISRYNLDGLSVEELIDAFWKEENAKKNQ